METTTLLNSVIPHAPLSAHKPKRANRRMIVFMLALSIIPVAMVAWYINVQSHGGIVREGNLYKVDLKSLGNFVFDKDTGSLSDVPHKWRELDGKQIELEGFMFSLDTFAYKVSDFQFVYNIQKCCFLGPPQVQERVFAHMPSGQRAIMTGEFCKLTGTLHVHVKKDEAGVILSLYTIDVDKVEPEG